VKDADFRWTHDLTKEPHPRLVNINLSAEPGELVTIVGPVASGKSTLIHGILGELSRVKGTVAIGGTVSYVPQSAFIINASIRYDISFTFTSAQNHANHPPI
jgi:ATP-binding cassette subfamily C (CFTR/MRP) protein 1